MANRVVSPPDITPPVPEDLTAEQCIALWAEVTDACEELLLAGLRREVEPAGDVIAAYRRWNADRMEEHEQDLIRMLQRLNRCKAGDSR
jgi:hypothetical protein